MILFAVDSNFHLVETLQLTDFWVSQTVAIRWVSLFVALKIDFCLQLFISERPNLQAAWLRNQLLVLRLRYSLSDRTVDLAKVCFSSDCQLWTFQAGHCVKSWVIWLGLPTSLFRVQLLMFAAADFRLLLLTQIRKRKCWRRSALKSTCWSLLLGFLTFCLQLPFLVSTSFINLSSANLSPLHAFIPFFTRINEQSLVFVYFTWFTMLL